MTITLHVPDFIVDRLGEGNASVEKELLRTFVCGLYREGRISAAEAMGSLNITSRAAFEELAGQHHAHRDWADDEVARELETIQRLNR